MSFPAATTSLDFAKPPSVVRAHFFDLDHAIRSQLHHGVILRWMPPEKPGERRLAQEIKMMTRSHIDVFVIEEGDGDTWVKRFVDGPNRDGRFVATFTGLTEVGGTACEEEGKATRVKLEAFLGPMGFFAGLGKLSQLGLQKALEKILEEHRRSLDGYIPGRARGAVAAVLNSMQVAVFNASQGPQGQQMRAVMTNLLEAACVVAIADGHADEAERDVIREVARTLCFLDLDAAAIDKMVQNVSSAVSSESIELRCDKIGARLTALGLGEVGLAVATLVAQISHGIDVPELAALKRLAATLGIDDKGLLDVIHHIDRGLSGAPVSLAPASH